MINEVTYSRQNLIKDLVIPDVVTVIGLGGTGFWTAIFLAMSGVKELILIDPDLIEQSNLNRLPITKKDIGKKKIEVIKNWILTIRNNCRIESHDLKIDNASQCSIIRGVVFCCTDNLTSQQLICAYAKKNNLAYQRIGYDGTILNISEAFPLSFEEKETQIGYTVTPSWVIPAAFSAAAGVCSKLYKKIHIMDDIGKIHILNCSNIPGKIKDEIEVIGENRILDNISEHIPDDYGYCGDCERVDVNNNSDYGFCPDCDKLYNEHDLENKIEEEIEDLIKQIDNDNIKDSDLQNAIDDYSEANSELPSVLVKAYTEYKKAYILWKENGANLDGNSQIEWRKAETEWIKVCTELKIEDN